jgi:hypothetical protein
VQRVVNIAAAIVFLACGARAPEGHMVLVREEVCERAELSLDVGIATTGVRLHGVSAAQHAECQELAHRTSVANTAPGFHWRACVAHACTSERLRMAESSADLADRVPCHEEEAAYTAEQLDATSAARAELEYAYDARDVPAMDVAFEELEWRAMRAEQRAFAARCGEVFTFIEEMRVGRER